MKTLLLLRHGKSRWSDENLADHDRPLKKRGIAASKRMGQLLANKELLPDHALTSSATRAITTAQLFASDAKYAGEIVTVPALYHAEVFGLVAVASQLADRFGRVLIVAHNPGLENWILRLIGRVEVFPTAALAWIELPIDSWTDLSVNTPGTLQGLWRPKELPDESV